MVRVYSKPFVTWIWFGCIIMSVGGLLAMLDRRYRRRREKKAAEAKPGIEPINYEEDKAAAEAEKKTEEEDDPFADIFKIFNRER